MRGSDRGSTTAWVGRQSERTANGTGEVAQSDAAGQHGTAELAGQHCAWASLGPMPQSFTITVSTHAPRALVWSVFADIEAWGTFGEIYREANWKEGVPWTKGSWFTAELLRPVEVTVDHRILACVPGERVNWSAHAIGVTI